MNIDENDFFIFEPTFRIGIPLRGKECYAIQWLKIYADLFDDPDTFNAFYDDLIFTGVKENIAELQKDVDIYLKKFFKGE